MTHLEIEALNGTALNLSVAFAEGWRQTLEAPFQWHHQAASRYQAADQLRFSTDWSLGGPIIEREHLSLACAATGEWRSTDAAADGETSDDRTFQDNAPLVAAMRAYLFKVSLST